MNITRPLVLSILYLVCVGSLANVEAVSPPPDGSYPGANTAEGQGALFSLSTGAYNTAVGWLSLGSVTTGELNSGVGAGTLVFNTTDGNTATGAGALLATQAASATPRMDRLHCLATPQAITTQLSGVKLLLTIRLALATRPSVARRSLTTPQATTTQLSGGRRFLAMPPAKATLRSVAAHSPTAPPVCLTSP
jgi:hypothetical protein